MEANLVAPIAILTASVWNLSKSLGSYVVQLFHTVSGYSRIGRIIRGSYMSAHVLLNLLNELGKKDKIQGLPIDSI